MAPGFDFKKKSTHLTLSRWRLRTQVHMVVFVLFLLVALLGAHALTVATKHATEVEDLLNHNVLTSSKLQKARMTFTQWGRAQAKYKVTNDKAYESAANTAQNELTAQLKSMADTVAGDAELSIGTATLTASFHERNDFLKNAKSLENTLEMRRAASTKRVRVAAKSLKTLIAVALVIAILATAWLALVFYYSLLKPLENIKEGLYRIREGDLAYRITNVTGSQELDTLRDEFNSMALKLEELEKTKAEFLSTISHELKTPLTAIKEGLLFLAEKRTTLSPNTTTKTIEICVNATKRLELMIQNLLNHARLETGYYSFDGKPKNFATVVDSTIQHLRPIADRRGQMIELYTHTQDLLTSFSTDGISHAIENLLMNAIKYADNSHPIVISIRKIDTESMPWLEFKVTNHGKGLNSSELTKIFEKFFRASNSDGQQGVGLGLDLVKRIIEAHRGTISVQSEDGITTFSFKIPKIHTNEITLLEESRG